MSKHTPSSYIFYIFAIFACLGFLLTASGCFFITTSSDQNATRSTRTTPQFEDPNFQPAFDFITYGCTYSYISNDPGYGHHTNGGGCLNGTATMETRDHWGTLYDALDDCASRNMRLPTLHELSAAGMYPADLYLSEGNYWCESITRPTRSHNCYMPTGNCGRHDPNDVQRYRCVTLD